MHHKRSPKTYHQIQKVMNVAMANEWINTNPVCLLKVKRNKVDVGFLNEEDIKAIQKLICRQTSPFQEKYFCLLSTPELPIPT